MLAPTKTLKGEWRSRCDTNILADTLFFQGHYLQKFSSVLIVAKQISF